MPINLLTRNTISILKGTWYTNMNCRYTNTWATSKCYVILHLIFFPIPTSNWDCNVLSVTTETQTPRGISILKYTFLYINSDHLRSPRTVLVRIQKIIITDNNMKKWNPLRNVSGDVKWYGHWQNGKWQAGDVTSDRALAQYMQALVSITSTTKKQARCGSSSKVKGIIPKGLKAGLAQHHSQ